MIATTKGQKAFQVFDVVFMIALAFVTLYPFYYVAVASFSSAAVSFPVAPRLQPFWRPSTVTI